MRDLLRLVCRMCHREALLLLGELVVSEWTNNRGASTEMEGFADIPHVFSTYETIHTVKDPEPVDCGINSFQLRYDGDRWWIMSLLWHHEREDAPLPERYH